MFQWLAIVWSWVNVYRRLGECDADRLELRRQLDDLKDADMDKCEEIVGLKKLLRVSTVYVDVNGRIAKCGAYFAELTGYTMDELIGMSIVNLIPGRYHRAFRPRWEEVATDQRPLRESPVLGELRRKDGGERQVTVSLTEVRNGTGTTKLIQADVRDRTVPWEDHDA